MVWTICATVEPVRAAWIVATAVVGHGASEDLTGAITAASEAAVGTETAEATAGTVDEAIGATRGTAGATTGETGTDGVEALLVGARRRDPVWKTVPRRPPTSMHPLACRNYSPFLLFNLDVCWKRKNAVS